jgi:hypothetical protein
MMPPSGLPPNTYIVSCLIAQHFPSFSRYFSSSFLAFPIVNWESKADRGGRSSSRGGGRRRGRKFNTVSTTDKTPPPQQALAPAAPRGSPIARKLARHATQEWATFLVPQHAIQVRAPVAQISHFPVPPLPPQLFAVPSLPDPTTAHQPLKGGCLCHERGPQHTRFLVSACDH